MEDLFPDDTPSVVRAREARKAVGTRAELQILIGSEDRTLNRQVGAELAVTFRAMTDMVKRVDFRRDISFFENNALLFLKTLI